MEPINVSTNLDLNDWRALQQAALRRVWAPTSIPLRLLLRLPLLLIFLMLFIGILWLDRDDQLLPWVVGVMGTLLLGVLQAQIAQQMNRPKPGGLALGSVHFEFDAYGIRITRPNSFAQVQWSQFRGVEQTATHIFIWVDTSAGYVVPHRDLPKPLTAAEVVERIRAFASAPAPLTSAMPEPGPLATPATAIIAPASLQRSVSLLSEIGAVLAQLLLLRVDGARFVGSDQAIGLLGGTLLAVWIWLDPWVFPGTLHFAPMAVSGLVFVIAGALGLAYLLARLSRPRIEYRRSLLVVTGAMAIAMLASTLAALATSRWWIIVVCLMAAYATQYFKLAFCAMTGMVQKRALLIGAAAGMIFVMEMDQLLITPSLWEYTESEDTEEPEDADDNDYSAAFDRMAQVQFGQQALIDSGVARIAAHGASGSQVYFLGLAGVGEQRVFAEEIDLAARRVAARYDAVDRELRLVNDQRSLERYPLASEPALRHALKSLGGVMDEDDVLFLSLSSHGGDDATLAVSNVGMFPTDIDAETLADDLRDSGIRWKVIVISACYAGGFIDALKDDHSIVITAAAADRTSFGCSDDNDLTYFGEAFYRDALPKAKSLREAFELARANIAAREKAEKITASNPQASFGALIERKLDGAYGSSVAPIR